MRIHPRREPARCVLIYGLRVVAGPVPTIAVAICAAVSTATTACMLAGDCRVEEAVAASAIAVTTLVFVVTLIGWIYGLG